MPGTLAAENAAGAAVHYYKAVNAALAEATSRAEAEVILNTIDESLSAGAYPVTEVVPK